METKQLSIYIHIPFCVRKCAYCDFLSMPVSESIRNEYVRMLMKEIEQEAVLYSDYTVKTVFFGGGTPTILSAACLSELLNKIRSSFQFAEAFSDVEISTECNPGTVNYEYLCELKKAGFNRLSIGLQSANNEELLHLGRIHTWEDFLRTYENAREAGFDNINIDLMSALPGQTLASYKETLEKVLALEPEHISAYSLILEEGTPFYDMYAEEDVNAQKPEKKLPDEDTERAMYELTEKMLSEKGYYRYEISNYAKKGKACKHNIVYWQRDNYLGLGLGAASLMENMRFHKEEELKYYLRYMGKLNSEEVDYEMQQEKYTSGAYQEMQVLSVKEQMEEFMFLGLRMMEGVNCEKFREQFGKSIESVYGNVLQKLKKQGLVELTEERICLTSRGIDVSNMVLSEFLL